MTAELVVVAIRGERIAAGPDALRVGVGPRRAADGLRAALLARPVDAVVNLGICGALAPDLGVGDVIVVDRWAHGSPADEDLRSSVITRLVRAGLSHQGGSALTVRYPLLRPWSKHLAHRRTGARICEMEGSALAAVCAQNDIPFAAVRTVIDDRDTRLRRAPLLAPQFLASLRALRRVARALAH